MRFLSLNNISWKWVTCFLLTSICNFSYAQGKSPQIKFDAKITTVENQGSKLEFVKVFISINGELKDSLLAQNGRIFYTLDTGNVYKINFKKSGYVAKHLVIVTKDAPEDVKRKSALKVDVSLFKYEKGLKVDFLQQQPIGLARYNDRNAKLEWDRDYTRLIVEKIITATLEHYEQKQKD